jgi:hypothetical protein
MRNTRSWKHNRKDRKQYIVDGCIKDVFWGYIPISETPGMMKRQTEFMMEEEYNYDEV